MQLQPIIASPKARDIYTTVSRHGTVSKQTLLEESGLTISTLTRILEELLAPGLLLEAGFGDSTGAAGPFYIRRIPTTPICWAWRSPAPVPSWC